MPFSRRTGGCVGLETLLVFWAPWSVCVVCVCLCPSPGLSCAAAGR